MCYKHLSADAFLGLPSGVLAYYSGCKTFMIFKVTIDVGLNQCKEIKWTVTVDAVVKINQLALIHYCSLSCLFATFRTNDSVYLENYCSLFNKH